ncbi:MAG: type II CRISPR RNA-guided endonuclease Cas9 [Deltaproteobacteria bacterium]|nr:type II CRISPR RNA-guided endonuclease Cas9 [Deltaproteobacteria bacterium]
MDENIRVLGLDIGPNSIGWAIIEYKQPVKKLDPEPIKLIDTNARIFSEGVDRTPQGAEQSKNAARRAARSMRRTHQRRNKRKSELKAVLQETGLLPADGEFFSKLMLEDPYRLRYEGLDKKLDLHSFGRALYHLAQRRGFKSNRKSENKKEDGKIAQGMTALAEKMKEKDCQTLGKFLYKAKNTGDPVRFRHIESSVPNRDMYENEFNLLWAEQSKHYPDKLNEELRKDVYHSIFFQRPFDIRERWGRNLERLPDGANAHRAPELGRCEYEPSERRSPRATWWAQRFRMLQEINNLQIVDTATGEVRDFSVEERANLVTKLGQKKELSFDQIRKLLDIAESCRFNLEGVKRTKLKGNSTEWNLRLAFKKEYDTLSPEVRDTAIRAIIEEEDENVLTRRAMKDWGLDEKGAKRLASSALEGGYLNLSVTALKRLVPHLEEGWDYMKAVELAGYKRRDQRAVKGSGAIGTSDIPSITNPLVLAALFQLRKVVNELIRVYGVFSKIRVELVRDLKNSRERRQEIMWEQRENEKRNEDAAQRLEEDFGISAPKPDQILKYKLWEECERQCPYTGRAISKEALSSEDIEVEHIIPYSRSGDDSYMNKTLCFTSENRIKENKTPFEFYGHDEKRMNEILMRVKKFPDKKRDRFYLKEVPDDFITRQLNDTAYIAREVRSLLEKVAGKNNVQVAVGQSTSALSAWSPEAPQPGIRRKKAGKRTASAMGGVQGRGKREDIRYCRLP